MGEIMKTIIIKTIIFAMILLGVFYFIPKMVLVYYEHNGYTFKEKVALISEYLYESKVSDPDDSIVFDYEVIVESGHLELEDQSLIALFSDQTIFDIGIMSNYYIDDPIHFYSFEFLYGTPFEHSNEIVITKSTSEAIFNTINGVGQTIDINHETYVVRGVVEDNSRTSQYIYFMDTEREKLFDQVFALYTIRIFYDEHLEYKLYQRGGEDLLFSVRTQMSQNVFLLADSLLMSLLFMVGIVVKSLIIKTPNDVKQKINDQTPIQKFVISEILMTIFIMYIMMFMLTWVVSIYTFNIGLKAMLFIISPYKYLLGIYLIPVIIYLIRMAYQEKHKEVNH